MSRLSDIDLNVDIVGREPTFVLDERLYLTPGMEMSDARVQVESWVVEGLKKIIDDLESTGKTTIWDESGERVVEGSRMLIARGYPRRRSSDRGRGTRWTRFAIGLVVFS